MRIEPRNNFPNVSESKEEIKNLPQFGIATDVKDRFEAATNQTARATIFDAKKVDGPRSERMETVNETRVLLEKKYAEKIRFRTSRRIATSR